jgi:hypothetical protein
MLTDAVMAIAVLGVVLTSFFACFAFAFGVVKSSRDELRATQILQEKMEAIRLYSWTQLNQNNFVPKTFKEPLKTNGPAFFYGTIVITNAPLSQVYSTNLRHVIVTLTWTNENHTWSRSNSTFVSRHGIQNYVLH